MGSKYYIADSQKNVKVNLGIGQEPKSVEKLHYYKKYINSDQTQTKDKQKGSKERKLSHSSDESINQ